MKTISVRLETQDADHDLATVTWNTGQAGAGKLTVQVRLTTPGDGRLDNAALEAKALDRARQIAERFLADLDRPAAEVGGLGVRAPLA